MKRPNGKYREKPTCRLRFIRRKPLPVSQREQIILQQWWEWRENGGYTGDWRDVELVDE